MIRWCDSDPGFVFKRPDPSGCINGKSFEPKPLFFLYVCVTIAFDNINTILIQKKP